MAALLFIVLSFIFGSLLLKKISLRFNVLELFSGGFIVGTVISTWLLFCLSLFWGINRGMASVISMLAITDIFLLISDRTRIKLSWIPLKSALVYLVFSLFWASLLFPLFLTHMLERKTDGVYSGGGAWGDIALHATFVEKFSASDKIDLTSPIYSQEKTAYPFMIDFYAGILKYFGFTLQAALVFSGFMFIYAAVQLLYFLSLRLFRSQIAAFISTVIFLFNGGLGVYYFVLDFLAQKDPFLTFLGEMKVEYAHLAIYNIHWSNIIADYVLPQRAFLAGLPIFLLLLLIMRSLWLNKKNPAVHRYLLCALIGLLPLWHTHTFLAAAGLLAFFVLADICYRRTKLTDWILPLVILSGLAIPQIRWQFSQTTAQSFTRIQFGWMAGKENLLVFWLRNMGLEFLFFVVGGVYFLVREKKQTFLKLIFIPLSLLFLLTNIVVFQPHDYDNMKLMIYSHLAITLVVTLLLAKIWNKHLWGKILALVLVLALCITGTLSIWRESYTSWQIANNSDLEIGQYVRQSTSPTAIFLTADSHRHPVTMLAGRSIVMGYRGWLWTHGIDYAQTEADVTSMFAGGSDTSSLLDKYNVSFVYIGDAELTDFHANLPYFQSHYPVVFQNESGIIFDVRGSTLPSVANTKKLRIEN